MKIYINLLPEQRKQEIKRNKLFRTLLREEFLFFLPVLLFIFILANAYYILILQRNSTVAAYTAQQSQEEYRELNKYEEEFKKINETDQLLGKIQTVHLNWTNMFVELSAVTPEGISIKDISTKEYIVFLTGIGRSRDDLIEFKNNLENSECFQKINVPLSNLVVKNNIDFQIDLTINEECLKQK